MRWKFAFEDLSALLAIAFVGGGFVGAVVTDAVAHPESDYYLGVGVGRLFVGFFVGAIVFAALTAVGWSLLRRRRRHRGLVQDD